MRGWWLETFAFAGGIIAAAWGLAAAWRWWWRPYRRDRSDTTVGPS